MIPTLNDQQSLWTGKFGDKYIERNTELSNFEYTDGNRKTVVEDFFINIPINYSILEIGCNTGNMIRILRDMGFTDITGLDINQTAIAMCRLEFPQYEFIHSSIESFQLRRKYDLVYTSGVLVHIHPDNLERIIRKIKLLSRKYIFGLEYYSETLKEVPYHDTVFWNGPYASMFGLEPKRLQIHEMKDETYRHIYYLL